MSLPNAPWLDLRPGEPSGRGHRSVETTESARRRPGFHGFFKSVDDLPDVSDLVLVVNVDCTLCDRARALLGRLGLSFRELDLANDEAGELAGRGVPVVFFPVLLDGERVLAYGDISEAELRRVLPLEVAT